MADVTLERIYKSFGTTKVINDVNLHIRDGEFVVFVGPSGCGKTTLLRMIAGLETITSGNLSIGGEVVNDKAPKDRNIAMVFQNYALYSHMTVFNNIAFGLRLRKVSKSEITKRTNAAATTVGMQEYLDRKPKQLSGGQRQRVALARAIVRQPGVFLFDEPLSNLDAKLRVRMRLEISSLQRTLKTTAIYVTHDQVEAMTMADRIAVINEGQIQQVGTPMELYHNPANIFVAGFIGSPAMNFIAGEISDGIFRNESRTELFRIETDNNINNIPTMVTLGFRPEALSLEPSQEVSEAKIRCKVQLIEQLGSESFVYLKYQDSEVQARVESNTQVNSEEEIDCYINLGKAHIFDNTSQLAITNVTLLK